MFYNLFNKPTIVAGCYFVIFSHNVFVFHQITEYMSTEFWVVAQTVFFFVVIIVSLRMSTFWIKGQDRCWYLGLIDLRRNSLPVVEPTQSQLVAAGRVIVSNTEL